jgi:hypothetical protein
VILCTAVREKSDFPRSYLREWAKLLASSFSAFIVLASASLKLFELVESKHWLLESTKVWVMIAGGTVGVVISVLFARETFRAVKKSEKKKP